MPSKPTKKQFVRRHKKDFHWEGKNHNPFHLPKEESPLRLKLLGGVGMCAVCSMVAILLYHPFFHIQDIHISGLTRIGEQEFIESVGSILRGNKHLVIPRKNYFFLGITDLEQILKDRFILEEISILATFPATLDIVVQEKVSTIIYDDGGMYSYMGIDGKKVEDIRTVGESEWFVEQSIVTSTLPDGGVTTSVDVVQRWHVPPTEKILVEMGTYPIIYDQSPEVGEVYQYTPSEIEHMLEMTEILDNEYHIPIAYITTPDEVTATYVTEKGARISTDMRVSTDSYAQKLKDLTYTVDISQAWEVDLRFGDRVYVR